MPEMLCQISEITPLQQTSVIRFFFFLLNEKSIIAVSKMPACSHTLQLCTADLLITLMVINANVNN